MDISKITPERIANLDESIEYLKTDYMNLYFMHRDNPDVPAGGVPGCPRRGKTARQNPVLRSVQAGLCRG